MDPDAEELYEYSRHHEEGDQALHRIRWGRAISNRKDGQRVQAAVCSCGEVFIGRATKLLAHLCNVPFQIG